MIARSFAFVTAAAAAAVLVLAAAACPPAPAAADAAGWQGPRPLAGAFHVHTSRSDGAGTKDEVAEAARRAGLDFVVFADHGDGTTPPDPPEYRSGVLCLDAVEISTDDGHYIALGMRASPYPLGGEGRDVAEDVARLDGFGIVAHPDSPKPGLAWRDWSVPADGLEWLNGDSEWRDEGRRDLARVAFAYLLRPAGALAEMLDRPQPTLARWDDLLRDRPIVALAGADAHGPPRVRGGAAAPDGVGLPGVPSYDAVFDTFSVRALPDAPPTGDAGRDAAALVEAIRRGRVFSAIDALAAPPLFAFTVRSGAGEASMGETLTPQGPVILTVRAAVPAGARIVLFHDGAVVAEAMGPGLSHRVGDEGAYRAEVWVPDAPGAPPVPWIVGNAIYVGRRPTAAGAGTSAGREFTPAVAASDFLALVGPDSVASWRPEEGGGSTGAVETTPRTLGFQYALAPGAVPNQYAGVVREVPRDVARYDRVVLTARADRPMRISVQLRSVAEGRRWRRSVYLSTEPRRIEIPLQEFRPIAPAAGEIRAAEIQGVLIVVDRVNAVPGSEGSVTVSEFQFAR